MTLIGDVFGNLGTFKNVVRYMAKKSNFRGISDRQDGKRAQTLLKSEQQNRYDTY